MTIFHSPEVVNPLTPAEEDRYQELKHKETMGILTPDEKIELEQLKQKNQQYINMMLSHRQPIN